MKSSKYQIIFAPICAVMLSLFVYLQTFWAQFYSNPLNFSTLRDFVWFHPLSYTNFTFQITADFTQLNDPGYVASLLSMAVKVFFYQSIFWGLMLMVFLFLGKMCLKFDNLMRAWNLHGCGVLALAIWSLMTVSTIQYFLYSVQGPEPDYLWLAIIMPFGMGISLCGLVFFVFKVIKTNFSHFVWIFILGNLVSLGFCLIQFLKTWEINAKENATPQILRKVELSEERFEQQHQLIQRSLNNFSAYELNGKFDNSRFLETLILMSGDEAWGETFLSHRFMSYKKYLNGSLWLEEFFDDGGAATFISRKTTEGNDLVTYKLEGPAGIDFMELKVARDFTDYDYHHDVRFWRMGSWATELIANDPSSVLREDGNYVTHFRPQKRLKDIALMPEIEALKSAVLAKDISKLKQMTQTLNPSEANALWLLGAQQILGNQAKWDETHEFILGYFELEDLGLSFKP